MGMGISTLLLLCLLLPFLIKSHCTPLQHSHSSGCHGKAAPSRHQKVLQHAPAPTTPHNVQLVCSATRYPTSCGAALLPDARSVNASPHQLVVVLTAIAKERFMGAITDTQTLAVVASTTNNITLTAVSEQCNELLDLAAYHVQNAEAAFGARMYEDIEAWLSGALQQCNDCYYALDAFRGLSSVDIVTDMIDRLNTTVELVSNSLALTGAMMSYGPDVTLWKPPPESRDDQLTRLAEASTTNKVIPNWMAEANAPTPQAFFHESKASSITVVQDSSSPNIQAAVNQAPSWNPIRYVIYIKAGVYKEIVRIPKDKINLMFVGDGRNVTIITGSLHVQSPGISTWLSATVAVNGAGFIARGITFENTAGPEQHQAVALRVASDKSAFQDCSILGHQDSLYTHSMRQFYKDCTIAGTVDFIFGNSAAVFQTCNIVVRVRQVSGSSTNPITAQGRIDPGQKTALVFQNCSIDGTPEYNALRKAEPTSHRVYLGRPWKMYSRTIFVHTNMSQVVQAEGWLAWNGTFALNTLLYAEYGSWGPGAADASYRVEWSNQFSWEQAHSFSAQKLLHANAWLPATAIPFSPLVVS